MASEPTPIGPGKRIRLHLVVYLEDGTEALSSLDGDPIECRLGDGTLAPGLEELLQGLVAGDDQQFLADGSAVFGDPDPDLIQHIPHADLPAGFEPQEGQVIQFEAPGGQEAPGTILARHEHGVEIDFNHPLSSRGLRIRARVIEVT